MKHTWFGNIIRLSLLATLIFGFLLAAAFGTFANKPKISQAAFQCPAGYSYFAGDGTDKSKPLPHNCTKVDDMVLVCENNFLLNTNKTPLHSKNCIRDLVVFPCSIPLGANEFVIHKSFTKKINLDGLNQGSKGLSGTALEQYNFILNEVNTKSNDQMKALQELNAYNKPVQTSSTSLSSTTTNTQNSTTSQSEYDKLTPEQKKGAEVAIGKIKAELDSLNAFKESLKSVSNFDNKNQLINTLKSSGNLGEGLIQRITSLTDAQAIQDKYAEYGDLCTKTQFKDNFNVGNICNRNGGVGQGVKDNYINAGGGFGGFQGLFANSGIIGNSPVVIGGVPTPDKNGFVSYFNDLATSPPDGNALFDLFNNDSSRYTSQLCRVPTKALRARIFTRTTRFNPGCFLGIGCTSDTVNTYIDEAISEVADSCNLEAKTCISKIKCIRTIHKCEPQNITYPIGDFNYYIGAEFKNEFGFDLSNGRSVQFEADYENLPQERYYLPNQGTQTICPNDNGKDEWRPFYVAARSGFQLYDTSLMRDKPFFTPFTCVKKGFDLRSAIVSLRDKNTPSCGARTEIYGDTASSDGSAFIICTPPLDSDVQVLACPGGNSVKPLGDYTNIEGDKCFKSIEPEIYIVDNEVIGKSNCTPSGIKPNTKLNCVFGLNKSSFAGYETRSDLSQIASDPNYKRPTNTKFDSCNASTVAKTASEIYYDNLICATQTRTASDKKYLGFFTLPSTGIKVKIQNSDKSVLTTSDSCKIPSSLVNGKTQYENLLVCENIKIGETFSESSKDVVVQIGDSSFVKGSLDAKLGGCGDGVYDIYDCYKCVSGQAYAPGKPCFQPGESVAQNQQPITATKGNLLPTIPLKNETLPSGTQASLKPEGCNQSITGVIQTGGFVPNPNQVVPECAKPGPSAAILEVDGKRIQIPINFGDAESSASENPTIGAANPVKQTIKVGDSVPTIDLPNNTLPNGTPATFTPNGASISIKGIIKDNQFVPDPGQTIPVGSTPGSAVGILKTANSTTGVLVNIQSNPELIKNVPFVRTGGAARN
jgi:hypothetical protein